MKLSLRGALGAAFILGMCALCVRLGFWQLDRLEQRRARNHAVETAFAQPPLVLDAATAAAVDADPARFVGRRVRATGVYAPAGEVVLRGRVREGRPGVFLATPLTVAGLDRPVMINRGFVPSPDAASVENAARYAEGGTRTVEGVFQTIPVTSDSGAPSRTASGTLTYRRLDLPTLRAAHPGLLPLAIQQLPGPDSATAGPPLREPLPPLTEGSHFSYAVQWFSFATIGVVGLAILVFRANRRRRE
ncbi:MAG TPA: SURF1 family protein [Longimicrobium sp.]|nr:SURF1 family protein [Longimicrobium sp.]